MGLLDAPGLPTYQPQRPIGSLMAKLQAGQSNASLCVLGDSTGAGNTRWPYLTAQQLGALFPAYLVRYWGWNTTNLNYDALGTAGSSTQIQAGIAPAAVSDSFTRANSATLGNSDYGFPWQLSTGTIGITSNKAAITAANAMATLSVGYADHSGSIVVTMPANKGTFSSVNARVYLRTSGYTNTRIQIELELDDAGSNFLIYKVVNGVSTSLNHDATVGFAYGGSYTLTWTVTGSTISATVNGKTITATLNPITEDPKLLDGTSIGIASVNQWVGLTFSNLTVAPTPPTLDVYNASASGQISSYSISNLTAQIPVHPDQIFINYGHNEQSTDARPALYPLLRDVREYHPRAGLAVILQNPRSVVPTSQYGYLRGEGSARTASIAALASQEGVGVVNVYQRFLKTPNYSTTMLNSDGLHPSDGTPGNPSSGGSPLWADEVIRHLAAAPIVPQAGGTIRESRRYIPASSFLIVEGSPSLGVVNGSPAYAFPAAAITSIVCTADVPGAWQTLNIYAIWDTAIASGYTGANNQVRLELLVGSFLQPTAKVIPTGSNDAVGPTALATQGVSVPGVGNDSIAYTPHSTPWAGLTITGRPLQVQVRRQGTTDSLTGAVNFRGLLIERAS